MMMTTMMRNRLFGQYLSKNKNKSHLIDINAAAAASLRSVLIEMMMFLSCRWGDKK